jgi:hypothetical protein
VSHDKAIDLTEGELVRLEDFAKERGITIEQAAALLAQKTITTYFVIPKKVAAVVPFRPLKRG